MSIFRFMVKWRLYGFALLLQSTLLPTSVSHLPACEPLCSRWGGCAGEVSGILAGSANSLPLAVPASACLPEHKGEKKSYPVRGWACLLEERPFAGEKLSASVRTRELIVWSCLVLSALSDLGPTASSERLRCLMHRSTRQLGPCPGYSV